MSLGLEERTIKHASYTRIVNILQLIEEIDSSTVSSNAIQYLGRIEGTFLYLKAAIEQADPFLTASSVLNNISNSINNSFSELNYFKSNRNEGHLTNAIANIENILPYLPQILITKNPEEIEGIRTSVTKFRQSIGQFTSNMEREAKLVTDELINNKNKLMELSVSIEGQKTRVDTIISDFQKQFLDSQSQRNDDFNELKISMEDEFADVIKNYDDTFEVFKKNKDESVTTLLQEIELLKSSQENYFDELIADYKVKVQSEFESIIKINKEAEKIVGIISMKGLAHGYQKIANSERNKSLVWNIGSLISMLLLIWFGYQYIINHEGSMIWTDLISRLILTGIGITLFTYCAKQATNHRNEERRNRKIELELASLDPYLKDLEPAEQKSIKQNLVDKYFGVEFQNTSAQQSASTSQQTIIDNPQLIQAVAERVSQLIIQKQ